MKQISCLRVATLLATLLMLSSCGGGQGDGAGREPDFVVPPRPESFGDRSGLNQKPPEFRMDDQIVPLVRQRPVPLTRAQEDAIVADATQQARAYLQQAGYGADHDVQVTKVLQDETRGTHVKFRQLFRNVPVLGTGLIWHTTPQRGTTVSVRFFHPGLTLDVRPTVSEEQAVALGLGRYGDQAVDREASAQLAILPHVEVQKVRNLGQPDNTDDFERKLTGAQLVWQVDVTYKAADLAEDREPQEDVQQADLDDATTEQDRRDHARRGTDAKEPTSYTHEPIAGAPMRYLFDALTGALVSEQERIDHGDFVSNQGTGHGYLNGTVPLDTSKKPSTGKRYLMDTVRPQAGTGAATYGNWVLDAKNTETHTTSDMWWMTDYNDVWGDGSIDDSENAAYNSARRQTPAVDVAHAVQTTWDFYDAVLRRWGPDGLGGRTKAAVHWGDGYGDAHYDQGSKYVVFGDGSSTSAPGNYALPLVGHELGHAFWHAVGNGTGTPEANALNEGHGDIQGGLVKLWFTTGAGQGSQIRHFPNFGNWFGRDVDPDTYSEVEGGITYPGLKYWSSTLANGPEHVGGLPFGRAMIYLAEGAPSNPSNPLYSTEFPNGMGGIGPTFAAWIWEYAIAYYSAGTPDYANMRVAFIEAAECLFGQDSMPVHAVRRAFKAIRVGASYADTDAPQFLYAQVFDVNPKDMTARILAIPYDDTGFRELRVDGYQNHGFYKGDLYLGYASIARAPAGTGTYAFTIEDSSGKVANVNRQFVKTRDRNLIQNGDFEDGGDGWTEANGTDTFYDNRARAFIGNGYAAMQGSDTLWQQVTIPAQAENVSLVFRLLVRDSVKQGDSLLVQVRDETGSPLQTLATYGVDAPADTRDWINKGFLRQAFDLGAYAGQTIRVAFVNTTSAGDYRFLLDQVVLTYEEEVDPGLPAVEVAAWDDTVSFTLPDIGGATPAEILRVDWYVDNQFVGAGPVASTDWFGSYFLSSLTPGAHWVAGRVRALDGTILADTQAVWFEVGAPYHELLVNKEFESGAWDLTYSDPPPKIQVVPNASYPGPAFHGQSLKMGGLGEADTTRAGQAVQMPLQMATLKFSLRLKIVTAETVPDGTTADDDYLRLEIYDLDSFSMLAEYPVAHWSDQPGTQGEEHLWRGFFRREVSIPPALVAGRHILVRLRTNETSTKPTTFFVDNASLRYTQFGIQSGGG